MLVTSIHLKPATLQVVSRDVKDKIKNDRRDSGFGFEVANVILMLKPAIS